MIREARLSEDRRYRYTLTRRWGTVEGGVTWIMCNPSTADAEVDDPTIRRCMTFTQRFGFEAMVVVNCFAYRATDPAELVEVGADIAQGPYNGGWVREACEQGKLIVAAWGALKHPLGGAAKEIAKVITGAGHRLKCLGKTKDGSPRHPLYVRADAPLIDWM
jgi:hypothetical protein